MFEKYLTKTGRLSPKQPQEIKNQWYIQKFQEVHGNKYDYSKVVYINSSTKVEILCREHGIFQCTPNNHITKSSGCPACAPNQAKTMQGYYIPLLNKIHHNKYSYEAFIFMGVETKSTIVCPIHGDFLQDIHTHQQGHGCPRCAGFHQDTIYLLRCLHTNLIKIGITKNLTRRLNTIGGSLQVLHSIKCDNPRQYEQHLHLLYQQYRRRNNSVRDGNTEFFQLSSGQVGEVIDYLNSVQQGEF